MKCKYCKTEFKPRIRLQNWCSPDCGYELSKIAQEKKQRKKDAERKAELRPLKWYREKAQRAFNRYIVLRDAGLKCISCNATGGVKWSCGHYKTSGANPHLTFNEDNCAKQCWFNCNSNKSGNVSMFRLGLIERIGIDRVNQLDNSLNTDKKSYTKEELLDIEKVYKNKIKEMT